MPEPGSSQGFNRYAYVKNNPLRYTDPSGHCPICTIAFFAGLVAYQYLSEPDIAYAPDDAMAASPLPPSDLPGNDNAALQAAILIAGGMGSADELKYNVSINEELGVNAGANEVTGSFQTSSDLYATGNSQGPRPPRIEGYQLKPGQKADINVDANGNVIPGRGGASTSEQINQLTTSGHVWRLPAGSELPGFDDVPDGVPFGSQPEGHHSLVPNMPMTPEKCVSCYQKLPWKPVIKPDGQQLKLK